MIAPHTVPHLHRMPFSLYRITVLPPPLYPRYAVHRICAWGRMRCTRGYGASVLPPRGARPQETRGLVMLPELMGGCRHV
jgi:hypothetical protein